MKMHKISSKAIMIMLVVALVMMIGGVIFHRSIDQIIPFVLGVLLTTALNVVKLLMIERTAERIVALGEGEGKAKAIAGFQYLIRYFLTFAVFLVAAFVPFIDIFGAVFGIFTLTIAMYILRFVAKDVLYPEEEKVVD